MTRATSRTFRSGNSEAVRLPRDVAYGRDVEVEIVRAGDVLTIYPKRAPIADMLVRLKALPKPTKIERREKDLAQRRRGL
jgi:antitoxin VapB